MFLTSNHICPNNNDHYKQRTNDDEGGKEEQISEIRIIQVRYRACYAKKFNTFKRRSSSLKRHSQHR